MIETNIAIVCACLPTLRGLAMRIFPSINWLRRGHDSMMMTTTTQTMTEIPQEPRRPIADELERAVLEGRLNARSTRR